MPRLFQHPFSCQPTSVCACEASVDPTGGERLRGREPRTESTMRESRAEQLTAHQSTLRKSGELSCVGRTLHYSGCQINSKKLFHASVEADMIIFTDLLCVKYTRISGTLWFDRFLVVFCCLGLV